MSMSAEKKNKRHGLLGTILFHSILLICCFFLGLTYYDPPPAEEGISINFGFEETGSTNEEKDNDLINKPVEEEIIEKKIDVSEEVITQEIIETPIKDIEAKEKIEKKEKENTTEEIIEEKKPEVNKKALYKGKKKETNTSKGNQKNKGDAGIIEGEKNTANHTGGGIGDNGNAYQLGGRTVEHKPKPVYQIQVEGKVVVIITVDRKGNVISAIPGAKGSTTLNKELLKRAKTAALKTRFNAKPSAPNNQQGKIIYYFNLN